MHTPLPPIHAHTTGSQVHHAHTTRSHVDNAHTTASHAHTTGHMAQIFLHPPRCSVHVAGSGMTQPLCGSVMQMRGLTKQNTFVHYYSCMHFKLLLSHMYFWIHHKRHQYFAFPQHRHASCISLPFSDCTQCHTLLIMLKDHGDPLHKAYLVGVNRR